MRTLKFLLLVLMLTSTRMLANNLPPESVIEPIPNRSWLYTGEWAFFNGASSYDRDENGNSITNYYWHIRIGSGSYVQKSSGSSASNYHVCFELGGTAYATTSNGCIAMGSSTTATVRLKVYDDEGSYDYDHSTITIKIPAKSRYFITDHLGNIRTTINEDGQAMGADDYFPFGLVMPGRSNTTANANDLYKYTSHERDEEAFSDVLDYMLARNYDPVIGRMNQIDPLHYKAPSLNPYRYAFNNPIRFLDPSGMYEVDGHYWTVYLASIQAGRSDALGLAYFSELPDHVMTNSGSIAFSTNTWMHIPTQSRVHALTGSNALNERHASRRGFLNARSMLSKGEMLHRLGDSYAHTMLNGSGNTYISPFGHGYRLGTPDKIAQRPGLYLEYVKDLLDLLGAGDTDLFTFEYVAFNGGSTEQNSAILETEIRLREGKGNFSIAGSHVNLISNYLHARSAYFGGSFDSFDLVSAKVTVFEFKDGKWIKKRRTRTFIKTN